MLDDEKDLIDLIMYATAITSLEDESITSLDTIVGEQLMTLRDVLKYALTNR